MTDFDDVLERLLVDPAFKAAMARDPQAALHGYRLDDSERELLTTQFVTGDSGDRTVETRANKSGVVGLVGPVAAALGVAASGFGSGGQPEVHGGGGSHRFGLAPGHDEFGSAPKAGSFGEPHAGRSALG